MPAKKALRFYNGYLRWGWPGYTWSNEPGPILTEIGQLMSRGYRRHQVADRIRHLLQPRFQGSNIAENIAYLEAHYDVPWRWQRQTSQQKALAGNYAKHPTTMTASDVYVETEINRKPY